MKCLLHMFACGNSNPDDKSCLLSKPSPMQAQPTELRCLRHEGTITFEVQHGMGRKTCRNGQNGLSSHMTQHVVTPVCCILLMHFTHASHGRYKSVQSLACFSVHAHVSEAHVQQCILQANLLPSWDMTCEQWEESYLIKEGDVEYWHSFIAQKCGLNLAQPFRGRCVILIQLLTVSNVRILLLASRANVPCCIRIGFKPLQNRQSVGYSRSNS